MEQFIEPVKSDMFIIYSKSGCPNCTKAKELFKRHEYSYEIIDCDDWLIENKKEFLEFISKLANKNVNTFPIIFDGLSYVGGYEDTKKYIEELNEYRV